MELSSPLQNVTLILPTLNNGEVLDRHLSELQPLLAEFGQIIAVDSFSNDGTFETLRRELPEAALIYQRERGLYQSWNDAISRATQQYCYISTIGDFPHHEVFRRFASFAIGNSVDLAISPPAFVDANFHPLKIRDWPIHEILDLLEIEQAVAYPNTAAKLIWDLCFIKRPFSSLSGSFASNLCATKILRDAPFPTDFSGAGDVVWMAKAIANIDLLGVFPDNASVFLIHESSYPKLTRKQARKMLGAISAIAEADERLAAPVGAAICNRRANSRKRRAFKKRYGIKRVGKPAYWKLKLEKKRISRMIRSESSRVADLVVDKLKNASF